MNRSVAGAILVLTAILLVAAGLVGIAMATVTADLGVGETTTLTPVIADHPITYTITVVNNGPDPAGNVTFHDTLPADVMFGSASGGGTYDAGTHSATWNLATLNSGQNVQETLSFTPIEPGEIHNDVSVSSGTADPTSTNNTRKAWNQVIAAPDTWYVSLRDSNPAVFNPPIDGPPFIPSPPFTVQWNFFGPSSNSILDASGMDFVDSGTKSAVSYYSQDFTVTSEFRIKDKSGHRFKLAIPVTVKPRVGTTNDTYTITGASAPLPAGYELAYHIMKPGGKFEVWQRTTARSVVFDPSTDPFFTGAGTYAFSSRLVNTNSHTQNKLGPKITVEIDAP